MISIARRNFYFVYYFLLTFPSYVYFIQTLDVTILNLSLTMLLQPHKFGGFLQASVQVNCTKIAYIDIYIYILTVVALSVTICARKRIKQMRCPKHIFKLPPPIPNSKWYFSRKTLENSNNFLSIKKRVFFALTVSKLTNEKKM